MEHALYMPAQLGFAIYLVNVILDSDFFFNCSVIKGIASLPLKCKLRRHSVVARCCVNSPVK